jgi:1,4-dihydroxy-2-naphthoate octaprenyltransferase
MRNWITGARLRTLPLAIAPVAVGYGLANASQSSNLLLAALALVVALALQIGVNFSNDYSDGIRGTDDHRVGPKRLTASGAVPAKTVRNFAFGAFGVAALAGLAIVVLTGIWWLLAVGAACVIAAWFYTGGKKPYGYAGLGEIFVFVFFGLVATIGTVAIQVPNFFSTSYGLEASLPAAIAMGCFAAAVLMVNNIRDIDTDKAANKKTLAVRVGKGWAKAIYFVLLWAPMFLLYLYLQIFQLAGFAYFVLVLHLPITLIVATSRTAREYVLALKLTSYASLAYALLLANGLINIV